MPGWQATDGVEDSGVLPLVAGEFMQQDSRARQPNGRVGRVKSRVSSFRILVVSATSAAALLWVLTDASAQALDCARLQQQIAQSGGGRYSQATRRQSTELARTRAYAHQLGCDGFSFFGANPQCSEVNARIGQMQANLGQLQGAGGDGRGDLIARFNAYCRGGSVVSAQPRGFLESIFGGGLPQQPALPPPPTDGGQGDPGDFGGGLNARGGSQAVCVRSCDGGFFPLGMSARHGSEDLTEMCQALCPGTETAVYTRNPDSDIKTALGLDGKPYMDLPNALHFQKSFASTCSCRQAGKSWAETLANAEEVLDSTRKGDIVVTPEKSAELSRPKGEANARQTLSDTAPASKAAVEIVKPPADAGESKRTVRQVGPQP